MLRAKLKKYHREKLTNNEKISKRLVLRLADHDIRNFVWGAILVGIATTTTHLSDDSDQPLAAHQLWKGAERRWHWKAVVRPWRQLILCYICRWQCHDILDVRSATWKLWDKYKYHNVRWNYGWTTRREKDSGSASGMRATCHLNLKAQHCEKHYKVCVVME